MDYRILFKLTMISLKLAGNPLSESTTSFVPSGADLIKSRTSRATLASVRGGKFSLDELFVELESDRLE